MNDKILCQKIIYYSEHAKYCPKNLKELLTNPYMSLGSCFVWADTKEGHTFWETINTSKRLYMPLIFKRFIIDNYIPDTFINLSVHVYD